MTAEAWATAADVVTLTGKTVTEAQRAQAVAALEVHIGLIEAVERVDVSDRDRYFLKLATCYQAAWLAAQPDLFERNDVANASQDGESATFRADAHTLAPLARKAVKRLSWRGPRELNVPGMAAATVVHDVTSEAFDDSLPWRPV
jgi:hypothetical protein